MPWHRDFLTDGRLRRDVDHGRNPGRDHYSDNARPLTHGHSLLNINKPSGHAEPRYAPLAGGTRGLHVPSAAIDFHRRGDVSVLENLEREPDVRRPGHV